MAVYYQVLTDGMTLEECVFKLLENRVLSMPVVDKAGQYIGQFRKNLVVAAVLPHVAVHDKRSERITRLIDTGLLHDTMADVHERFSAIANDVVSLHLDTEAPILRPEHPMVTALYHLYRGRNFLPVVEAESNLLVGVVSAWDVLKSIVNKP